MNGKILRSLLAVLPVLLLIACGANPHTENGQGTVPAVPDTGAVTTAAETELQTEPAADESVVVYTPHDAEPMNAAVNLFMTKYPDITVEVVAGGTGELCERVKREAADPQADVLWGGGADSLSAYAAYFEPYVPAGAEKTDPQFKDANGKWLGESPLPMVIIFNKKRLREENIPEPAAWDDCLKPEYKGKIAYCSPAKSGSAYTQLCTMILSHGGGEAGWDFVRKFYANLDGKILDSSGKCHKLVASGEYLIGITIEKSAQLYDSNPDIGYCYPSEGTSAVPDATGIVLGCPHEKNARLFADFVASAECQTEQSLHWGRRPARKDVRDPAHLKPLSEIRLISYDFDFASGKQQENLARFEALGK